MIKTNQKVKRHKSRVNRKFLSLKSCLKLETLIKLVWRKKILEMMPEALNLHTRLDSNKPCILTLEPEETETWNLELITFIKLSQAGSSLKLQKKNQKLYAPLTIRISI